MIIKINFKSIRGLAIFPFIFTRDPDNKRHINHERIHHKQQIELLFIPFFVLYGIFQLIYGYKNNPFEMEAFDNDDNLNYLKERKLFAWTKNIKKK